jgi:hypothetical protein
MCKMFRTAIKRSLSTAIQVITALLNTTLRNYILSECDIEIAMPYQVILDSRVSAKEIK